MKNIAIILARSGSKGLINKNIKKMAGHPLMSYTIGAAIKSGVFDVVHVSTDSEEYADIARQYGADVPFLRADELATDNSSSWDAMRYVITKYGKVGKVFDTVTLLQPTSPLRNSEDIENAFRIYKRKSASSVISVCETDYSPLLCNNLPDDYSMEGFIDVDKVGRRQDMKKFYRINGAIYIQRTELLMNKVSIYQGEAYAYLMEKSHSIDIDDELDFVIAEAILKKQSANNGETML